MMSSGGRLSIGKSTDWLRPSISRHIAAGTITRKYDGHLHPGAVRLAGDAGDLHPVVSKN